MKGNVTREQKYRGRQQHIEAMATRMYDVLIIGGGITGAGIALDAQQRGMDTALIDMQDFAAGTSSRSTKLVHGGLRYLKQFEIKMVAEVGKERAIVYENGPHVTTPEWMLLPLYQGGSLGKFSTSIGLWTYDFLAGVKRTERHKMLSKEETLDREPLLRKQGLKGGGYYVEYRTDDARLTMEVLKKAIESGAHAANYVKAKELLYEDGKVVGVVAEDVINGRSFRIKAKQIVNATGPWVDTLRDLDQSKSGKMLRLTKGIHLVFDGHRFPLRQAIYFDAADGRMIFAIPRDGKTYVGTTDTDYEGDMVHPRMSEEDQAYLLNVTNDMFPDLGLSAEDVQSSWAGLRPLIYEAGKPPSEVSRKDEIFVSPSGMITIAGGKLTGYRKMAEDVVDLLAMKLSSLGRGPFRSCVTRTLPISGGDVGGSEGFLDYVKEMTEQGVQIGLPADKAEQLVRRYGSNIAAVFDRVASDLDLDSHSDWDSNRDSNQDSHSDSDSNRYSSSGTDYGLPSDLRAELLYCIDEEMVVKPVDYFVRRTGALLFDMDWVLKWKDPVIAFMADYLHYTEEQKQAYAEELEFELEAASTPLLTQ